MVVGLNSFREWFRGYERNYAIIGGTACDLLMTSAGVSFRATKDIDMVLIVEVLNAEFGLRFWEYVKAAGYVYRSKSTGAPEFYRFIEPKSAEYPVMIELFSRHINGITLPPDAVLTPLPIDDDISSLSAILLDDNYYEFLKSGVKVVDGISVLSEAHLIPFKAKAWLDLTSRRAIGGQVDSRNIKKHKNDAIKLSGLFSSEFRLDLPETIKDDIRKFLTANIDDAEKLLNIAQAYGVSEVIPVGKINL